MPEYIRRSLAEEAIEEYICRRCEEYNELAGGCISHAMHCPYLSGEEILKPVESEDVQPVKHGYWEEVTDYGGWGDTHYRCSVCGEEWYLEDGKPKDNNMNFCPRCGAKMDAEPDEPWQSD